jgi:hypothetical protein
MSELAQNRREPIELSAADGQEAIGRIEERDAGLAREASHVLESLTWGEGPRVLRQAGVQDWLWYVLPTKYLTDEVGYMTRLAEVAAVLFDELGLHRYAAICRSDATRGVHAGFDESDAVGLAAMRRAKDASGIEPPDVDDFEWGGVMGYAESTARSAMEDVLEAAIVSGRLVVGSRGWRRNQAEITVAVAALNGDHPVEPGQSWRTVVVTERLKHWVEAAERRCGPLAALRGRLANRLLHPIAVPAGVVSMMMPMTWFLSSFGDEQPLTQAGYLSPAVVRRLHAEAPWDDPLASDGMPRTEIDAPMVHQVRTWLQSVGALRKHNKTLRRTKVGAAAADPEAAWRLLISNVGEEGWDRFVLESCGLVLLDRPEGISLAEHFADVAAIAADMGWATPEGGGQRRPPGEREVARAFHGMSAILTLCDVVVVSGDWRDRRVKLSVGGEATMLAAVRLSAAGPRSAPW